MAGKARKAKAKPLGRDDILAVDDAEIVPVPVPEWGGTVWVRSMTAGERDALETRAYEMRMAKEPPAAHALTVIFSACDKDGNLLFTEADLPALAKKRGKAMNRILAASQRLNFTSARDIEELAGN